MAKVLMVISPNGYQDFEYEETKKVLVENGHTITTASTTETALGALGGATKIDTLLGQTNSTNYDAIVFIGGPGTGVYFQNQKAHSLAKEFLAADKLVAAICIAPVILANAGILEGKKATVFPSGAQDLANKGAICTGANVETDGKIVTANGPVSAKEFGKKITKLL